MRRPNGSDLASDAQGVKHQGCVTCPGRGFSCATPEDRAPRLLGPRLGPTLRCSGRSWSSVLVDFDGERRGIATCSVSASCHGQLPWAKRDPRLSVSQQRFETPPSHGCVMNHKTNPRAGRGVSSDHASSDREGRGRIRGTSPQLRTGSGTAHLRQPRTPQPPVGGLEATARCPSCPPWSSCRAGTR